MHDQLPRSIVNAACQVLFGNEDSYEHEPICYLASETEVYVVELLLTLLARRFTATMTGPNVYMPGINDRSADIADQGRGYWMKLWQEREELRRDEGNYERNRAAEEYDLKEDAEAELSSCPQRKPKSRRLQTARIESKLWRPVATTRCKMQDCRRKTP